MDNRHTEPDLETYKDAVWDFLLEHCDITERGSFFVKFHTSGRGDFEKRIRARYKYGYHRDDDRTGFDIRQKERDAAARKQAHLDTKASKRHRHETLKQERMQEAVKEVAARNAARLAEKPKTVMHSKWMQAVAQFWYTIHTLWQRQRAKNRPNRSSANTVSSSEKQKQD